MAYLRFSSSRNVEFVALLTISYPVTSCDELLVPQRISMDTLLTSCTCTLSGDGRRGSTADAVEVAEVTEVTEELLMWS